MRWTTAALVVCISVVLNAASTSDRCAACHPAETKLHQRTRMARAMVGAPDSLFALNLPDQPLRESNAGFAFVYKLESGELKVTAIRGSSRADGLIQWVLGAGAQGQTPLVETGASTLESRVSYFPELHRYGITIGQDAGPSPSAETALGRKQRTRDAETCIGCHATSSTGDLQPFVPGIQCERCHSGAEQHAQGNGKPLNPGRLSGPEQVRFCGSCHRAKPPVDDIQLENVRFQPLRLMKSRCFASGKVACTTCHPAHQDARRNDAAFYNSKCLACHDSPASHTDERGKGDCIGCHMPYVQLHPALRFTDHFIRVVKPGDLPASALEIRHTGSGS